MLLDTMTKKDLLSFLADCNEGIPDYLDRIGKTNIWQERRKLKNRITRIGEVKPRIEAELERRSKKISKI